VHHHGTGHGHGGDHGSSRRDNSPTQILSRGVWRENPVFVHLMGLCPALAVTNSVVNGLSMALATAFVLIGSSVFVSTLRKVIPGAVRISTYVLIVGTFVTVVDLFMRATVPAISKALGAFVYLIVVNCMILGRHEAYASKNSVGRSMLDATGTSLGFLLALVLMGGVRELLGSGELLGFRVTPSAFEPWVVMALPPGGFFTIGFVLLGLNAWHQRTKRGEPAVREFMHPVVSSGGRA
jgi:H+/Na+-translocating ferredoxin:NAD+ oxidoreductase subunit E